MSQNKPRTSAPLHNPGAYYSDYAVPELAGAGVRRPVTAPAAASRSLPAIESKQPSSAQPQSRSLRSRPRPPPSQAPVSREQIMHLYRELDTPRPQGDRLKTTTGAMSLHLLRKPPKNSNPLLRGREDCNRVSQIASEFFSGSGNSTVHDGKVHAYSEPDRYQSLPRGPLIIAADCCIADC